MTRGAFIVVEGVDRSGKTTQCTRLADELQSQNVIYVRFPDRTTNIGSMIDSYLKNGVNLSDESIHLLYSANRWEKKKVIEDYLNEGKTVLCDRYAYSGVAFSMAKGMDRNWCQNPDKGLPRPDTILFLHVSSQVASSRPGFGDERYEESEFQLKVREAYNKLENEEEYSPKWTKINAERTQDEVFEDMKENILKSIKENEDKPLLPLWQK